MRAAGELSCSTDITSWGSGRPPIPPSAGWAVGPRTSIDASDGRTARGTVPLRFVICQNPPTVGIVINPAGRGMCGLQGGLGG